MARVFTIRIRRSDRDGIDPVRIRADTRRDAEMAVFEIYANVVLEIIGRAESAMPI